MTIEDRRLKLHEQLCGLLGSCQVYYDPPSTVRMKYPAIVYVISSIDTMKADNRGYLNMVSYTVTLIRKDDNDDILDRLLKTPYTRFSRSFVSDNLHHDVVITYA